MNLAVAPAVSRFGPEETADGRPDEEVPARDPLPEAGAVPVVGGAG